jgi:uncharacterized protein (TIGR03437 family)
MTIPLAFASDNCGGCKDIVSQPLGFATGALYAGPSPGLIWGVTQVNLIVPASVTPGNAVPLAITVGGVQSQPNVTLTVN